MTPLRRRMIEDMKIRNFSGSTQAGYIQCVAAFAEHFAKSPEQLGPEDVRVFLAFLVTGARVSYGAVRRHVSALRFLYKITLGKPWDVSLVPYPRPERRLPEIPSRAEIVKLLGAVPNLKHRTMLTTCYATGLRVSEVVQLKVADIDSERMTLRVRQGKRHKDRILPLSHRLLELLRAYWRVVRPSDWLFPGRYGQHLSPRVVQHACRRARRRSGLKQAITVHTLRHYAESRIMPSGSRRPPEARPIAA